LNLILRLLLLLPLPRRGADSSAGGNFGSETAAA